MPKDDYLFSNDTLPVLKRFSNTADNLEDQAILDLWKTSDGYLPIAQCPTENHIVDFDREHKTLTPVHTSKCNTTCKHSYTTDVLGSIQTWHSLDGPTNVTTPYDAASLPTSIYIEVRCLCGPRKVASTVYQTTLPSQGPELVPRSANDTFGGLRNYIELKFDALSRTRTIKYMPKFIDIVKTNNAKPAAERKWFGFMMGAYHSVGHNTPGNEMPHYLGKSRFHWKWKCCGGPFPHDINAWIWNDFKDMGWKIGFGSQNCMNIMGYCEGLPDANKSFDYMFRGVDCFDKCHEFNFWRTHVTGRNCYGDVPAGVEFIRYISDAIKSERGRGRLAFFTDFIETHNMRMPMTATWLEEAAIEAVNLLMEENDETMLVLYGDHGAHYGKVFDTNWGSLDYKLPVMQIFVPQWWLDVHPDAMDALTANQHEILTLYDLHATMHHLLEYPTPFATIKDNVTSDMDNKNARSLIEPMQQTDVASAEPSQRTCRDAGIPDTWCILQDTEFRLMDADDLANPDYQRIVDFAVDNINQRSTKYREICPEVSVRNSTTAFQSGTIRELTERGGPKLWIFKVMVDQYRAVFQVEATVTRKEGADNVIKIKLIKHSSIYKKFEGCRPEDVDKGMCLCGQPTPPTPPPVTPTPTNITISTMEDPKSKIKPKILLLGLFLILAAAVGAVGAIWFFYRAHRFSTFVHKLSGGRAGP